jgi:hypothetical protein
MNKNLMKLTALAGVLLSMLAVSSPARAESAYGKYPNSYSGPYVYQISVNTQDPPNGARYAYGMFTNCQVYTRSYHYWYASTVNYTGLPDSYNGWCSLDYVIAYGAHYNISMGGFQGWTPHQYLSSRSQYLPSSSGTRVTVPGGVNWFSGGTGLTSRTYPYTQSFNVWDDNYIMCCENGEGC